MPLSAISYHLSRGDKPQASDYRPSHRTTHYEPDAIETGTALADSVAARQSLVLYALVHAKCKPFAEQAGIKRPKLANVVIGVQTATSLTGVMRHILNDPRASLSFPEMVGPVKIPFIVAAVYSPALSMPEPKKIV